MVTYYIYEVPGHKNGATIDWKNRSKWNFKHYGIEPILIETMEGPDEPNMWKLVGDREWELADTNGYDRGAHYLSIRQRATRQGSIKGGYISGRRNAESGQVRIAARAAALAGAPSKAGKAAFASPNHATKQKKACVHCGYETNPGLIKRWHNDNCKHKKRTAN
jgi:hypothetical protein